MYEAYYHLQAQPFTLLPDPEFLYLGTRHKMALSLLEYGLVNGSAFTVMTGEPGTGKTTLLNRTLDHSRRQWTVGLITNTHTGLGSLLPWIAGSFGLETKGLSGVELMQAFARFLAREQTARRRVLLVLDEAQNLSLEMLEELRLLSNLNDGRRHSLQILLSGQPGLRTLLQNPSMVQLAQRIAVEYGLESLAEEDVHAYINHRIRVAGGTQPLFSTRALRTVSALSGGNPRLINQLCDHALAYGYAAHAPVVTATLVLQAATDRDRNGIVPFRVAPSSLEISAEDMAQELREAACRTHVGHSDIAAGSGSPSVSSDPSLLYREGLALKQAGTFSRAIALFDRLADDPAIGGKALAQKGLCLKAAGREEDAVAVFRRALLGPSSADPDDLALLQYLLGRTLESRGRAEEALECYRAIRLRGRDYRDVALRMDRLQAWPSGGIHTWATSKAWARLLVRRCRQVFRNTSSAVLHRSGR